MMHRTLWLFLIFCLIPASAHATKTVTSPYVTRGEVALESKTGYLADGDDDVDGEWEQVVGMGYGLTDFWSTKVEAEFVRSGAADSETETDTIEWQNKFQFTPRGEGFVDAGARIAYKLNTASGVDEVEAKLLLGKKIGPVALLNNVIVSREVGEDASDETEYELSWSAAYQYSDHFRPGIEIYNEFGNFEGGFDEQEHLIGPVAYGKIVDGLNYNTGVLFGASDAAPDATLKLVLEYKFSF